MAFRANALAGPRPPNDQAERDWGRREVTCHVENRQSRRVAGSDTGESSAQYGHEVSGMAGFPPGRMDGRRSFFFKSIDPALKLAQKPLRLSGRYSPTRRRSLSFRLVRVHYFRYMYSVHCTLFMPFTQAPQTNRRASPARPHNCDTSRRPSSLM